MNAPDTLVVILVLCNFSSNEIIIILFPNVIRTFPISNNEYNYHLFLLAPPPPPTKYNTLPPPLLHTILTLLPHAIYNHIAATTLPNSPHTTSNTGLDAYADRICMRAIIRTYFNICYQLSTSSFTNTRAKQYHTFIIRNT